MSQLIDISVPISTSLPVWPTDPRIGLDPLSRVVDGDGANITHLSLSTHAGTHVDPPYHFFPDGATLDSMSLDDLNGTCWVCDLTHLEQNIGAEDLEAADIPEGTTRLLLRTRNSELWSDPTHEFNTGFIGLKADGALWVVERGIRLIGLDYHSIEPYKNGGQTHRTLLGAPVIILETIDLRDVDAGQYELLCLPLRIAEGDGAPCRAVLRRSGQEVA